MREAIVHLLLPFALPGAAESAAILQARTTPALDALLRVASVRQRLLGEDYQRSLPHERWLAATFGVAAEHGDGDLPLAPYMMLADGVDPGETLWACIQPVHVEVAHDHLVLIDPQALNLSDSHADALLREARPAFDDMDLTLLSPTPLRWYVSGAALGHLVGASPLRASGRSIDIWLPVEAAETANPNASIDAAQTTGKAQRSRTWMKLQNEVQMAWHEHAINQTRETLRELSVNSIWLHGQGRLDRSAPAKKPFSAVFSEAAASRGLALAAEAKVADLPRGFEEVLQTSAQTDFDNDRSTATAQPILAEIGTLSRAFIAEDWHAWLEALADIEKNWFAPALAALRDGRLSECRITLCGDTGSTTLAIRRIDLKKFWRRTTLASLLA